MDAQPITYTSFSADLPSLTLDRSTPRTRPGWPSWPTQVNSHRTRHRSPLANMSSVANSMLDVDWKKSCHKARTASWALEPRCVGRRNGRLHHAVAGHGGHHTFNVALIEGFVVVLNYAYGGGGGGVGSLHVIRVAVSSIRRTPMNAYPSLCRHRGQGCREAFICRCQILILL